MSMSRIWRGKANTSERTSAERRGNDLPAPRWTLGGCRIRIAAIGRPGAQTDLREDSVGGLRQAGRAAAEDPVGPAWHLRSDDNRDLPQRMVGDGGKTVGATVDVLQLPAVRARSPDSGTR